MDPPEGYVAVSCLVCGQSCQTLAGSSLPLDVARYAPPALAGAAPAVSVSAASRL
jgi:hypothetical protein